MPRTIYLAHDTPQAIVTTSACPRRATYHARMARLIDASQLLHRLLSDTKVTQAEFAEVAGVTVATVSRWANGHHLADARKIAAAITRLGADPVEYGIDLPSRSISNHQVVEMIDALREDQARQHAELLAALTELRVGIDILRARP